MLVCLQRWLHSLSPNVKKSAWTKDEDQLLLSLYETHGPKWSFIARQIRGRTDDACSKRYREALDPNLKKTEWTAEEDETDENKSQEKEEKPEVVKKAPPEENGSKEEVKDQPKPEAKEPENKEVEIEQQEEEPEEEDDEKEEGEEKKKSEKKASEITSLISDWAEDDDL